MTDFNLSAAISLQLATSAGTKLAEDINKAVNAANIKDVSVKITPVLSGMTAQLKRIFPESAATSAKVKISLSVNNPKEAKKIEDLLKEDRSIKIDVEFSDKAKKAIDDFSTSLSKLRESSKGFEELQKLVKYMNDVGKVDLENLGPSEGKLKSRAAKVKKEYEDLVKTFKELADKPKTGEFFPFSVKAFAAMKKEFDNLAVQAERFGAVNGKAAKNATFAIEAVFKAYKDLEIIQKRTEKSGLADFDPRISTAIDKAKEDAIGLLSTLDSIEQIPLAASLSAISAPIKDAKREAEQYRSLLRSIKKEEGEAVATGASDQTVNSLRERIRLTREARDNNVPINNFKESDGFIDNIAQTKNYNNVQRAALKASISIEKFNSEADLSAEFNTQGAAFSGMKNRLNDLTKDFEAYYKVQEASGDPKAATNITEALARLGIGIKDLKAEIKDFDTVLKNFDDKKAFFDEKGLTESSKKVEKAKLDFIELQKTQAQGRVNTSNNFFQQTNQQIEAFAENEKKLAKFISTLDRLKASLAFSLGGGEDFSGVGVGLDNLQKKVEGSLGSFDERKIKDTIASDSYMLRAKEKQNKVINAAISSFEQAASDSADSGPGRATLGPVAFAGRGEELNKFVRTLNLTSNSYKDIGKNIDIVKSKANELYALASIEADGGFIGSITKSLGLAAKRLTTFLFAARAIYGIQNAIIEATGSAVELDTEFTRLEQIFAGSQERIGSVEKNVQSLSNEILTLASNYGVAATEIAKSADIFAQAGIQGRNLQKILEISTKASVGPTFGSNIEISEAVIASMNQFRISADDMERVIGGISQVSAQFAVESDGITKAIRRAGGAFAAAKADGQSYLGALGDFVGAFTVLKEQTREADETLATSLRNVLNRLQRSNVRKYLKESFNIDLLDNGQFVGFAKSIELVSNKIKELGIKSGDPRFAELVQKLAGSLQSSRLTSLLAGSGDIVKAVAEFQRGGESLDRDAAIAFNSLENKLTRAKSAVVDLMTTIARSDALKTMIELFVVLTQTITGAVKALGDMGGAFGIIVKGLAAFSLAKTAASIVPKIVTRGISGLTQSGILGPARGFNTGGLVPGIGPNVDTEPYMLTKGEYVVNRYAVQKYGKSFFNDLNSGNINYAATGSGPNGMISSAADKAYDVFKPIMEPLAKSFFTVFTKFFNKLESAVSKVDKKTSGQLTRADAVDFRTKNTGETVYDRNAVAKATAGINNRIKSNRGIADQVAGKHLQPDSQEVFGETYSLSESPGNNKKVKKRRPKIKSYEDELAEVMAMKSVGAPIRNKGASRSVANDFFGVIDKRSYQDPNDKGGRFDPDAFARDLKSRRSSVNTGAGSASDAYSKDRATPDQKQAALARRMAKDGIVANPVAVVSGSPPSRPPSGGISASGGFGIEKLLPHATKLIGVLGIATTALGYYANSSKEASEKVKIMSDAAIAAALAITTFTVASNSASTIGSGVKNFFSGKGGGAANVTDTTKGFGGGGFFDKYATNKPSLPSVGGTPLKGVRGFIGRVGGGIGRIGGAINGGIGQAGAGIAKLTPTFAKMGSAALSAAKFLGPQVLGAAVVGIVAALGSFNDAAIKASEEIIANSTSEREVIEERANIDKRQKTGRGLGVLGKVAGGAAIGAVGGPVGAALGAVAGFFLGIATEFKDTGTYEVISKAFKSVYDFFAGVATVISDGIGFVAGALDTAFVAAATAIGVGPDLQKLKEKKDRQANLDKAGANLNSFNRGAKRTGGVTQEEFDNLLKSVKQTSAATSGFKSLDDTDKEKVKGQAERLKSSLDGANDFQKGSIINAAKKAGIDIKQMFQDVGLEFDEIGPQAAIASDKLSKMFAEMQSVTDRVGAIITNFNIGNEDITNKAAGIAGEGITGGVSSGVFDQLRKGGTPTGEAAIQTNQLFADLEKFSPAAALNAQVERVGAGAAFGVSNKLAGQDIKLAAGKGGDEVRTIISDMFFDAAKAGGGSVEVRDRLDDMLDVYLDSQQEALNGAVGNGKVSNEKVTEIINGFTDSIKRGGIDTAEAFNASNQQFKQAMDGIIKRRIEYEGKITDLAKSNVDKQKSIIEFQNKAAGKVDPEITLQQARGLDAQKRGIALRGTGVGGNASVADLSKRYNELTTQDPGGNDPQIQAFKESIYEELQNMANGTDSFTAAMREFDKASEKAKIRTEQLSDALLGTDENLFNTLKGIQLQQRVMGAGDKTQAFLALQNTDDASKQALQQRLNSDPEAKRAFETKLGIAPNMLATPQAAAVAGEFGTQTEAGNALIGINQNLSDQMGGLAGELVKNRASFEQFGLQINNFANAANNLANNLGNIPQNIAHSHTFTVEPIQISLTGAEALASLDGPLKGVITNIVNAQIGQFANNLKSKNKGLTVDALTGNTATA